MLDVPEVVREKALSVGAAEWLAALPELVREIEADWGITVGETFPFSTEAFVAAVDCADGTPAVLKLIVPREGDAAAREATALRLAGGEGCGLADGPNGPRRRGDLGMGRRRASLYRPARDPRLAPADRPADARRGRTDRPLTQALPRDTFS